MSEFLSDNFQFLVVKCSIYLNRLVFVMFTAGIRGSFSLKRLLQVKMNGSTWGFCRLFSKGDNQFDLATARLQSMR